MLENCPHCGSEAVHYPEPPKHAVICVNERCAASVTGFATKKEAEAAWNVRTPTADHKAVREASVKALGLLRYIDEYVALRGNQVLMVHAAIAALDTALYPPSQILPQEAKAEGLEEDLSQLIRVALTNPGDLRGFIGANYPKEYAEHAVAQPDKAGVAELGKFWAWWQRSRSMETREADRMILGYFERFIHERIARTGDLYPSDIDAYFAALPPQRDDSGLVEALEHLGTSPATGRKRYWVRLNDVLVLANAARAKAGA